MFLINRFKRTVLSFMLVCSAVNGKTQLTRHEIQDIEKALTTGQIGDSSDIRLISANLGTQFSYQDIVRPTAVESSNNAGAHFEPIQKSTRLIHWVVNSQNVRVIQCLAQNKQITDQHLAMEDSCGLTPVGIALRNAAALQQGFLVRDEFSKACAIARTLVHCAPKGSKVASSYIESVTDSEQKANLKKIYDHVTAPDTTFSGLISPVRRALLYYFSI